MHKYEKIKVEIDQLIKEGVDMYDCFREYLNSQASLLPPSMNGCLTRIQFVRCFIS